MSNPTSDQDIINIQQFQKEKYQNLGMSQKAADFSMAVDQAGFFRYSIDIKKKVVTWGVYECEMINLDYDTDKCHFNDYESQLKENDSLKKDPFDIAKKLCIQSGLTTEPFEKIAWKGLLAE